MFKLKFVIVAAFCMGLTILGASGPTSLNSAPRPGGQPEQPKKDGNKPRVDLYGDPLPPDALVRLGTLRFRGDASTVSRAIAVSADGKMLASTEIGATVRVWEAATGRVLHELRGRKGVVVDLAFSPNGKVLATASSDKSIRHWNTDTGKEELSMDVTGPPITSIAFSPDGSLLAGGCQDGTVRLWDTRTGKETRQIKGHRGGVTCVAFSPDGKKIASASTDKTVGVWETGTGKAVGRLEGHLSGVNAVAFSSDGKAIFSGSRKEELSGISSSAPPGPRDFEDKDGALRIWDGANGKALHILPGPKNGVQAITPAPGGTTMAVIGADNTLHLYEGAAGKELWQAGGDLPWVRRAVFAAGGKTLITAGDTALQTWDAASGKEIESTAGHFRCISAVAFTPDGKTTATGSWDHTIRLWDAAKGKERLVLKGHEGGIMSLAFSPDGALLASASEDRTVRLWDAITGKENRCFKENLDFALAVGFSADGKTLVSGGVDKTMRRWDVASGKQLFSHALTAQTRIGGMAISPDGKHLALVNLEGMPAKESVVRVYDTATGKEFRQLTTENHFVACLVFSLNGKYLATGSRDGSAYLWDLTTGELIREFTGQQGDGQVLALAFSEDDRVLATGADRIIRIWELATGQERQRFVGFQGCHSLAFDPGAKLLAAGNFNSTAFVWDVSGANSDVVGRLALTGERRKALWEDLQGQDAAKANQAIQALAHEPQQAVAFLRDHVRLVSAEDIARIDGLIRDLDSANFATRQKATTELGKLGDAAAGKLTKALESKPSAEVRRRVQNLLAALKQRTPEGEALRTLRAIEILERAGTAEARQTLEALAERSPWRPAVEQAIAALHRLTKQPPSSH